MNELQGQSLERTPCPHSSARAGNVNSCPDAKGRIPPQCCSQKCQHQTVLFGPGGGSGVPVGSAWVFVGCVAGPGRAQPACACSGGGSSGIQTPGTGGRMRGIRSCSRLPWLHISEKQAKGKKKKEVEENQNILLGGKKNSGVKKCRRVMRRPSEAKKCMRSSLETGV